MRSKKKNVFGSEMADTAWNTWRSSLGNLAEKSLVVQWECFLICYVYLHTNKCLGYKWKKKDN